MRILHFADTHARDKDIEEIKVCLGYIVQEAHDLKPDLIVMAGDTFDSRMVRLDSQAAKLIFEMYSKLADVAPMIVITGTPSHDGLAPQVLENVRSRYPVHVSDFPEQVLLTDNGSFVPPGSLAQADIPRAIITCIPTPTKQYWQEFGGKYESAKETDVEVAAAMGVMLANFGAEAAKYDHPHVLVGHFSVGGALLSETQQLIGQDIELSKDQIGLANADLVCLGHIHYPQQLKPNIFYSGSIYTKDFGELHPHGFYIHEVGGEDLTESRFIQTPTRKLLKVKGDFTNSPIEELDVVLYELSREEIEGSFLRVELRIYQDDVSKIDRNQIEEFYKSAGALEVDLKINTVPRETVRSATLLELQTLRDKVREMSLLRKEEVPETILAKADMLEHLEPDELCKAVANA